MKHLRATAAAFSIALLLSSCTPSTENRAKTLQTIAYGNGFTPVDFQSTPYSLKGWGKNIGISSTLRIYIEGDGFAWRTPTRPSTDPTPVNPMALKLASEDNYNSILYLGRPCQYYKAAYCSPNLWTDARFSQQALNSYMRYLDEIKMRFGTANFELIGYSGGGVMAALIAAQRDDVTNIRTIAAPLDTTAWTREKGFRPLAGSLNPVMFSHELSTIPQIHYIGTNDKIVPVGTLKSYASRVQNHANCVQLKTIPNATHRVRLVNNWTKLVKIQPVCGQ